MRVVTWNINGATKDSDVWKIISRLNVDIALLQEVGSIPKNISENFEILSRFATSKSGKPQRFSTVVMVKGKIIKDINLKSEYEWVNNELEFFNGNFIACKIELQNNKQFNLISVYSPAWPVDKSRINDVDVSDVKSAKNPDVWATDIIWSALKNTLPDNEEWIIGGDYNSSETFDKDYQKKHGLKCLVSDGNKEIRDRMYELGFKECLLEYNEKLIPTYLNTNKKILHQLDHLYVTKKIFSKILKCNVGNISEIFDDRISDHLPIITDFKD
jgi:exonuclease III